MGAKPKRLADADATLREWTRAKLTFYDALTTDSELTGLDCRIAWRLLHYHNLRRGYSWPSLNRLADEINATRRSVYRSIGRLIDAGWFFKEKGGGRKRTSHYAPNLSRASQGHEVTNKTTKTGTEEHQFQRTGTQTHQFEDKTGTLKQETGTQTASKTGTGESPESFKESFTKSLGRDAAPATLEGRRRSAPQDKSWWEFETCAQIEFGAEYDHVANRLREAWDNSVGKQYAAGGEEDRDQLRLRVFAEVRGGAGVEVDDEVRDGGGEETAGQRAVAGK